jgi:MFS family permease
MADSSKPTPPLRVAYWVLAALFAMNLLNYIDRFILASVLKNVREDPAFLLSKKEAGALTTAFFVSYALFSPLIGFLGDRVKRKYLLAAGVGVWSLATFASGLAASYGQLMLARGVLGVGEASYATLAPALLGDFFRRERRNRALTVFYVAIPLGAALGFILGASIAAAHGWRMAFFVVGLPGLAVALAALAIPEPRRGASEDVPEQDLTRHESLPLDWSTYVNLGRNRSYVYNSLGMAMFTFALGGLLAFSTDFLVTEGRVSAHVPEEMLEGKNDDERTAAVENASEEKAGLWLGIIAALSGLVGTALGGWLGGRLNVRWPGGYFWLCGLSILASVPFIFLALVVRQEVILFASLLIGLTLASMNYGPANTILVNVTDPKIRAAAFAVNIFLIHILGDIPSPTLIGTVADVNFFWGMTLTLPALLISGWFFCRGARHYEADAQAVLKGMKT